MKLCFHANLEKKFADFDILKAKKLKMPKGFAMGSSLKQVSVDLPVIQLTVKNKFHPSVICLHCDWLNLLMRLAATNPSASFQS